MLHRNIFRTFALLFLAFSFMALKEGDIIELEAFLNGATGLNGRNSANFDGQNNIEVFLKNGTRGQILEIDPLPQAPKSTPALAIKINVITSGENQNKVVWIYYNLRTPGAKLYKSKEDFSTDNEAQKLEDARALETTQAQTAVATQNAVTIQNAVDVNKIVVADQPTVVTTQNCSPAPAPVSDAPSDASLSDVPPATKVGNVVQLAAFLDGATGLNGRSSNAFSTPSNIQYLLKNGTLGEVVSVAPVPNKANALALQLNILSGDHKGDTTWVYYNKLTPGVKFYKTKEDYAVDVQVQSPDNTTVSNNSAPVVVVDASPIPSPEPVPSPVSQTVPVVTIGGDDSSDSTPVVNNDTTNTVTVSTDNTTPVTNDNTALASPSPQIDTQAVTSYDTRPPVDPAKHPTVDPVLYPTAPENRLSPGCQDLTQAPAANGNFFQRVGNFLNQINAPVGNYQIAQDHVSDSTISLQGKFNPDQKFLMVRTTYKGKDRDLYYPIKDCTVNLHVYLKQGPGDYSISLYTSTGDKNDAFYTPLGGEQTVTNTDTRDNASLLPSAMVQSDNPEIIARALSIVSDAHATTDREKAKAIHDWIGNNIPYDVKDFVENTLQARPLDAVSVLHSTTLKPPGTICAGYSDLYAALARAVGLKTNVMVGHIIWSDPCPSMSNATPITIPNIGGTTTIPLKDSGSFYVLPDKSQLTISDGTHTFIGEIQANAPGADYSHYVVKNIETKFGAPGDTIAPNSNITLIRAANIKGESVAPTFCGQTWEKDGKNPSQLHAWNQVLLDGKWVTVDTTWDAGNPDFAAQTFEQSLRQDYFDPDPAFFSKTHGNSSVNYDYN